MIERMNENGGLQQAVEGRLVQSGKPEVIVESCEDDDDDGDDDGDDKLKYLIMNEHL